MKKILIISLTSCCIHSSYAQQKVKVEKMPVPENVAASVAPEQAKTPAAPSLPGGLKAAILAPMAVQEIAVPPLAVVVAGPGPAASLPALSRPATPVTVHP